MTTARPAGQPGLPVLDECCAPGCSCCGAQAEPERGADWHRAARAARWLSWLSLAWMTAEGTLGLIAGTSGGSVSLTGWALGSVIEALASVIVIWRFTGSRTASEHAEQWAQRAVAVSFFLLAPYITAEAIHDLLTGHQASASALGLAVTASSLVLMPALGYAKRRLGTRLDSGATAGEGTQNLMCAAQAGAVLAGLAVTAAWAGHGSIRPSHYCSPHGRYARASAPGTEASAAKRRLQRSQASRSTAELSRISGAPRRRAHHTRAGLRAWAPARGRRGGHFVVKARRLSTRLPWHRASDQRR